MKSNFQIQLTIQILNNKLINLEIFFNESKKINNNYLGLVLLIN